MQISSTITPRDPDVSAKKKWDKLDNPANSIYLELNGYIKDEIEMLPISCYLSLSIESRLNSFHSECIVIL